VQSLVKLRRQSESEGEREMVKRVKLKCDDLTMPENDVEERAFRFM